MEIKDYSNLFFTKCSHHIYLEFCKTQNILAGFSLIEFENNTEFPNKICLQTPSMYYCLITSIEINGDKLEGWSINPVPCVQDANRIFGNNVYDAITFQMAYGFVSSNYGEKHSELSTFNENRLLISIPDKYRLNKNNNKGILNNSTFYSIVIKINFDLLLDKSKSPIVYVIEKDLSANISIIPQEYSKLPWFPTLSCSHYLTEGISPFWNSSWKFTCKVPNDYFAVMPGKLVCKNQNNDLNRSIDKNMHIYEYHYNSGSSFPHLYPNNIMLFIGKYHNETKDTGKNQISIFTPLNRNQTLNVINFVLEVMEGYEKILNFTLPMESVSIVLSEYLIGTQNLCDPYYTNRVSDTLANVDFISRISSPLINLESNFYGHLNETDIGRTLGNIIVVPYHLFEIQDLDTYFCEPMLEKRQGQKKDSQDNIKLHIRLLSMPILTLLDSLASLWFGSYIHVTSRERLPSDSWLLFGMKRYLMRQLAKKFCGEDLVSCRMKEALERCLLLIENGNDYIPLSVKDFYIPFHQSDTQGHPLIQWSHRENQTLFRLKSDLVFHSLECYVSEMIKGKARKVGFGFADIDASFKNPNPNSKFFNSFIHSFILKCCIKKNNRHFTTQHFFVHLVSCISQQFIHRSKKEIANAQLPQHEQYLLNEIQDELIVFRSAWIEGVGCPNLTLTSMIQLSNKNTSFDNTTFLVDQTPLQPPHLTSKEGISSFVPIVSIFRIDLNELNQRNKTEISVLDFFSYINGIPPKTTNSNESSSSIAKFIPPFLWPHDPNTLVLRESNITLLGLGYMSRSPIPIKCGFGPLFDSTVNRNEMWNLSMKCSESNCSVIMDTSNSESNRSFKLSKQKDFSHVNSKNSPISSNGSYNAWQLGYMNVLCYIFLKYYENTSSETNNVEWLCSEISSHIPISGGSGRFWPGYILISIIRNEENKDFELEIIEPQLPVIHELKVDVLKHKTSIKRESVSSSTTVVSSAVCVQSVSNTASSITNSTVKINEMPRLSLLQDLQQRKYFVGKLSNSDNIWLESLESEEFTYKNDSCDKEAINKKYDLLNLNNHFFWVAADNSQYWLAKIFRFQTWSMWDQQFLNEKSINGQIEAATQLGMERYIFGKTYKSKFVLLERAFHSLNLLMNSLYHFEWNLSVRKKALISIIKIYNKLSYQKLMQDKVQSIRTGVFSFLKKFIEEVKMIVHDKNFKNQNFLPTNIFIQNEKSILSFSIQSLSLLWDSESNSTSLDSLCFLTQLLQEHLNSYYVINSRDEFLLSVLKAIERSKINPIIHNDQFPLNKITSAISEFINNIPEHDHSFHFNSNIEIFGLIFKILSKHPNKIFFNVMSKFRNKFGTYLDPLCFIDLPFIKDNIWWVNYSSLLGSIKKPLYSYTNHPIAQLHALRCYFHLSLQGFIDTLIVHRNDKCSSSYKFNLICPEIVYRMITDTFFECGTQSSQNCEILAVTDKNKELENSKVIGLFNVWKHFDENSSNISFLSLSFPKNLLKTLCSCTLIHVLLIRSIKKNLNSGKCNSNQWKIISSLWSIFIEVFDSIIQDLPQLLNQFLFVQVHAEFEPLINSISNSEKKLEEKHLIDVKQCCLFISQVILNSPISLSSFSFEPSIFQNMTNLYISLFGHGIPVCMASLSSSHNEFNTNHLVFDSSNGYILSGTPEMPMKEAVRKRQRFLKRGCDLSDSVQIKRLCDDENYIMSRGWKHMCKKITQCLMESPFAVPFIHPVDENDAPEYYNLITQPIDLTTIMNKIRQDLYGSIEQYRSDIELIFSNCRKYNESSSVIVEWCNKIQAEFELLFKPVCKYFIQNKPI